MKKYLLSIVFIIGLFSIAAAQERSYTYIAQRYDWLAGVFRALGLPAGDGPADFQTGQKQRAGTVYYDSTGGDAGLYVWNGLTWTPVGKSYYANNGLSVDGDTIKLGGTLSALSHITTERTTVLDSNVILHFRSKYDGTTIPVGGENVSFAYPSYAPYQFLAYDTAYTSKTSTPYTRYPQSGVFMSRRIHFPVGGGKRMYGLYGNKSEIMYTAYDSAVVQNDGGDYGGAQINQFKIRNIPGYTGRTVFKMSHSATNDIINTSVLNIEGAFATLSNTYIENDNAANPIRIRGRIFGHNSYLVMGFTAADTLDEWVAYGSGTFIGAPAKITRMKFMQPAMGFQGTHADSAYFMYDRDVGYKSIHRGKIIFGQRLYTTSPYLLDVAGASIFSDTTTMRMREVTDTVGYDFVLRRRSDSALVRIEPWRLPYGAGGAGGFGSATLAGAVIITGAGNTIAWNNIPTNIFNDGTSNRIGYTPTNAYIVSPNGLRAVTVSNSNHTLDGYDTSPVADTTTVKPMAMDAAGNVFRAPAWYGTGSGGSVVNPFGLILASSYSLTSTTSLQKLFNVGTGGNGTLNVDANATYEFECMFALASMSATSGNAGFDILGAGTATFTSVAWNAFGKDATSFTVAATYSGIQSTNAGETGNIVTAGAGTGMQVIVRGIIRVNAAGTIIPSINLTTAASATVSPNSYIKLKKIGTGSITEF